MKIDKIKLDDSIKEVTQKWDASGAFFVVRKNELLHKSFFGYEDRENKRLTTEQTTYCLHAANNFFVGMGILILADQGKVDLNAPLSTWIPEYQFSEKIQLIHLLKHSSGIPDFYYGHLMLELDLDDAHKGLTHQERVRNEAKVFYENMNFNTVLSLIGDKPLEYEPGTTGKEDSESESVFLSEVIKRITGLNMSEFLREYLFKPLDLSVIENGNSATAVSYKEYRDKELVRCPLDFEMSDLITVSSEDMLKLLIALGKKEVLSKKMWQLVLKYDSEGSGMMFHNANGFDCSDLTFMGTGFYLYINHQTGFAFASLANEEQMLKNVDGIWHYFRKDAREVIEVATTFPHKTKMIKINKNNFWDALNLKVDESQLEFVLEAKSSVAMALMYPTKRAFVQMEGARAVGLLVLDLDKKKNHYNIDIIIIDKKFQNRGYGKLMLEWALKYLKKEGAKTLKIGVNRYNYGAKKIYMDAGFEPKSVYEEGMTLQMEF